VDTIEVPVLVAGGGPVGLATACFLGYHGVPAMLAERRADMSVLPRAPGIQARTLEIFRSVGLGDRIRALEIGDSHPYFEGGILRTPFLAQIASAEVVEAPALDGARISPETVMGCGQNRYERVLADAAREHGADLRFGYQLADFEQDGDGVTAELAVPAGGQRVRVRAQYLVAADGSRSTVRARLGTPMTGRGTVFHAVSIYFRAPALEELLGGRKFILCYATGAGSTLALSRLHGCDPWAGAVIYDPDRGESPADFTEQRCVEVIRECAGAPDLEVEIVGTVPWEGAQRVAASFRSGRVFLAGDAAHVHPPAGGFGANTGIHDAHNLSWKLAAVLAGWAGDDLLDTYDAERRPLGAAMAEQALIRNRIRHGHSDPAQSSGMVDDIVVTLGYRYHSAAVSGPPAVPVLPPGDLALRGEPGSRAPHLWLHRDGQRISSTDLFSDAFVLLAGPDAGAWMEQASAAAGRLGVPLRAHVLGRDVRPEDEGWPAALGIGPAGALLVRPDAFVAWRSASAGDPSGPGLDDVLAGLVGRAPVLS
jgi:2-polyprenyl-6-methoxyphenol hydroxylase-like FAD-dependent oxidoreductase